MRSWCTLAWAVLLLPLTAAAQSTLASISGTVSDEQHAVVPGATITLENIETGQARTTSSSGAGRFRLVGLSPGPYEMRVERSAFARWTKPDVHLAIGEHLEQDVVLRIAAVDVAVTVDAPAALADVSKTALGRTFSTKEIEELPVAARDFASLALLTPGILTNHSSARGSVTGITSAAQTGRNNTFLLDGLTLDEHVFADTRGSMSLEAIRELMVLSNSFSAEYGQASGAVVSVLTRSGTNQYAGRGFYFHRDDRWDATDAAATLTLPPGEKSVLEQRVPGAFLGGPVVRDRSFFFGSVEHLISNSESVVTSAVLQTFRPDAPTRLPVRIRNPRVFGRADFNLTPADVLTLRSRFDRATATNRAAEVVPAGLVAPERRSDSVRRNTDLGVSHTRVLGTSALNEVRFQFATRSFDSDVSNYCPGCPAVNRPGIYLGKNPVTPEHRVEDRWQVAESFTVLLPDTAGDHMIKAGFDGSVLRIDSYQPAGFDGFWTFTTDRPFDPAIAATYPLTYQRNAGEPYYRPRTRLYAVFVQDEWKPTARLALNLGVRWDYEDAPAISHDRDNVAPRIGFALVPSGDGRLSIRGSYGIYYDQVLFNAFINMERATRVLQTQIQNPGYPDPLGPNPNRSGDAVGRPPSTNRLLAGLRTPYSEQASLGVRLTRRALDLVVDGVWARGHNLLRARDLNYPDLTDPRRRRPDPAFQRVLTRETAGHSWYKALQVGVTRHHTDRYSYSLAYTLSQSDRDTEDWEFFAQDQRDYGAERGPSSSDVRHRVSAGVNLDLTHGMRFTLVTTATSARPYNIITGADVNGDTFPNDRPPGVGRNAGRGDDFWQADARLSKAFATGSRRIELLIEAFNLTNHRNWTDYAGNQSSATFGRPTGAAGPREIQAGIRFDF